MMKSRRAEQETAAQAIRPVIEVKLITLSILESLTTREASEATLAYMLSENWQIASQGMHGTGATYTMIRVKAPEPKAPPAPMRVS